MATVGATTYDEVRSNHRWEVPERYNIARDVCFRHPAEKLAMVHEDPHGNADRITDAEVLILDDDVFAQGEPQFEGVDTAADDPAQLYYTSGTTGLAKGIVHAHRYLLGHEEFIYCHEVQDGERFHGVGE